MEKRENIHLKVKHGEINDGDIVTADLWVKNILPEYLKEYDTECVYNADESALLFKTFSKGTLAYRHEEVARKKVCKDRITLLFITNSSGSDKHVYSIGKYKNPRCFKNSTVPIPYFANKNAWMTQTIWCEILQDLNKKMKAQHKKIILFVDNATCHKLDEIFDYVKVIFLPPNVTALIQPLDQGIIRSFKSKYRLNIARKHLLHIEGEGAAGDFLKKLNILEALKIVARAWREVTPTTIKNCFHKARFTANIELTNDEIMTMEPLPEETVYFKVKF